MKAFDLFSNGIIGDLAIGFQASPFGFGCIRFKYCCINKIFIKNDDKIAMKPNDQLHEFKAKGKLKRQFTIISNQVLISDVLDKSIAFK